MAISVFGDAGGFGLLTLVILAAFLMMSRVVLPKDHQDDDDGPRPGMGKAIVAGATMAATIPLTWRRSILELR